MSPKTRRKGATGWKPPRDRRELTIAVLASLAIVVVTFALLWFLRPNRNSGSTSTGPVVSTTAPGTTVPGATTSAPVTTSPATTSPATP
jgi:hypothetical protein